MMVILHEVLKLLHYAGAQDVKFFRIGTSGGLGNSELDNTARAMLSKLSMI